MMDVGDLMLRAESDLRFFQRRAAQERTMAARSLTDAARERHEMLARRFAEKAEACQCHAQYA